MKWCLILLACLASCCPNNKGLEKELEEAKRTISRQETEYRELESDLDTADAKNHVLERANLRLVNSREQAVLNLKRSGVNVNEMIYLLNFNKRGDKIADFTQEEIEFYCKECKY